MRAATWRTGSRSVRATFRGPHLGGDDAGQSTAVVVCGIAYVLICALRRIGLAHTHFAQATCGTIRLKLLKIGALVAPGAAGEGRDGLSLSLPERVRARPCSVGNGKEVSVTTTPPCRTIQSCPPAAQIRGPNPLTTGQTNQAPIRRA